MNCHHASIHVPATCVVLAHTEHSEQTFSVQLRDDDEYPTVVVYVTGTVAELNHLGEQLASLTAEELHAKSGTYY